MAGLTPVHAAVVEGAQRRLNQLRDRVSTLEHASRTREEAAGTALIIETCRQMIELAERHVRRQVRKIEQSPAGANDLLVTIRTGVDAIHRAVELDLDYLARPPLLDVEPLIRPFTRLAKLLTDPLDSELVFAVHDRDSFRVWADAFEFAKLNASLFTSGPAWNLQTLPTVAIVSYPSYTDADTFQQCVLAHEVAHLVLQKPLAVGSTRRLDDLFRDELNSRGGIEGIRPDLVHKHEGADSAVDDGDAPAVPPSGDALPELPLGDETKGAAAADQAVEEVEDDEAEFPDAATKRLGSWFAELACDLIAIRSFGPAFLFALVDYVLPIAYTRTLTMGEHFRTHPPTTWRLAQLTDEARAFVDQAELLGSEAGVVRAVFDAYVEQIELHRELEEPAPMIESEEELLKAALERVRGVVPDLIGKAIYEPTGFGQDVPIVFDKLRAGIAPVERIRGRRDALGNDEVLSGEAWSVAIDWRSILNSSYIFFASGESRNGPLSAGAGKAEQRDADCRISRGAVELSELLRQMRDLKGQFAAMDATVA